MSKQCSSWFVCCQLSWNFDKKDSGSSFSHVFATSRICNLPKTIIVLSSYSDKNNNNPIKWYLRGGREIETWQCILQSINKEQKSVSFMFSNVLKLNIDYSSSTRIQKMSTVFAVIFIEFLFKITIIILSVENLRPLDQIVQIKSTLKWKSDWLEQRWNLYV